MLFSFRTIALCALLLFLFSCEKKYLEIVPVTEKIEDLSVPDGGNIKFFTFPSPTIGYAAADTNFIFKTADGGKTWEKVEIKTSYIRSYSRCKALEFFDERNGICVMNDNLSDNTLMTTSDGGQTWSISWGGGNPFAGITKAGKAYICEYEWSRRTVQIKESTDKGKTFKNLVKLYTAEDFNRLKVMGTAVYILTVEGTLHGYDPVSADTTKIHIGLPPGRGKIYDFVLNNWVGVAACQNGIIKTRATDGYSWFREAYNNHDYNYYSVDAFEDFAVAVGEKTIATNMDTQDGEAWHEVLDQNGSSFKETFYKIKFMDRNHFYVSGAKGLIWKMKI